MNKILCLIFISFVIFSCSSDSIEFEEQIWGKWYVSENVKSYINDTLEVDNTTSFRCEFSSNKLVYFEYNFSKDTAEWIYIKSENSVY